MGTTDTLSDGTVTAFYTDKADVIYDTGTTLMYGPSKIVSQVTA